MRASEGASFAVPSIRVVVTAVGIAFLAGLLFRFPDYLTAGATAVLAGFGAVQVWSEWRKRESEERTANARVSVNAFEARKALAEWILKSQEIGWAGANTRAQEARDHARSLLSRFEQALVDVSAASPLTATRMRAAYAHLRRAEIQFDAYLADYYRATQEQLRNSEHADAVRPADDKLLGDGRESLRACCNELEHVVEPTLVADAKRFGAWRAV